MSEANWVRVPGKYGEAGMGRLSPAKRSYTDVMRALLIVLAIGLVATTFAASENPIQKGREAFVAAFNKGDGDALTKLLEKDCLLETMTGQMVTGGKGIAMGMAGMSQAYDLELKPQQFRESGDMAYEAGTWTHFKKGTKDVLELGAYVWIWKKESDGWRMETLSVNKSPTPKVLKTP